MQLKQKKADKSSKAISSNMAAMKKTKSAKGITKQSVQADSKLKGKWATLETANAVLSLTADISKLTSTFATAAVQFESIAAGYESMFIDETDGEEKESMDNIDNAQEKEGNVQVAERDEEGNELKNSMEQQKW